MNTAVKLYTPQVLTLATVLADYPLHQDLTWRGSARSSVCGSTLEIGFDLDAAARITRVGLKLSACAVGQASAALFAQAAPGRSRSELQVALEQIETWLRRERNDLPAWPGCDAIAGAVDYPGRHGAIVLPWKAALATLP